jgi:hypothetical protein
MAILTAQRELDNGAGAEIIAEFEARERSVAVLATSASSVGAVDSVAAGNPVTPAKGPLKSAEGGGKSGADGKGGHDAAATPEVVKAAVSTPVKDAASVACIANWIQGVLVKSPLKFPLKHIHSHI